MECGPIRRKKWGSIFGEDLKLFYDLFKVRAEGRLGYGGGIL